MKKPFLFLSLFLSFSSLVHAQWTTNGANTITSTTNSIGIGTTTPQSLLHISGTGTFINQSSQFDSKSLIIQSNNGGRGLANGAQLEFVIPANTDGTNPWGQARIITVAGNSNTGDATGKMILGTRRMFNKIGAGATWYYGDDITIDGGGKVGIGTTIPNTPLDINGAFCGGNTNLDGFNTGFLANSSKILIGWNRTQGAGETDFIANQGAGTVGGFAFYNHDNNNSEKQLMWLTGDGRLMVGLSTGNTGNNKLAVGGGIIAEAVTVKLQANWPDYVFKKDYQLPSLQEVKAYIDQNQHLPEIPSEQQIAKDGLNLGEMNKLLMKKMEEMTLYMIEAKEEINELKKQVQDLKKQNK
ncbi:hypothetical protein SAMN05428975_3990 [Mucilaginibacter sp. OK268]|uniref:hypothetical protein n=1 Tax=Mucilaginibacter sp. OK268 TaxID=1881048 RepID=UPI00087EE0C9|nr:hypothetical protein [Mucilaginibacter sp. OK268]SDP94757.1 hypothetical protein SAMN05428975_3990 [Mucilaginibacter sp. OK268]